MSEQMIGVVLVILSNVLIFLWLRTESSADRREMHSLISDFHKESKEFHGRLIRLEERYLEFKGVPKEHVEVK